MARPRSQHPYQNFTINHKRKAPDRPTPEQIEAGRKRRALESRLLDIELENSIREVWDDN